MSAILYYSCLYIRLLMYKFLASTTIYLAPGVDMTLFQCSL